LPSRLSWASSAPARHGRGRRICAPSATQAAKAFQPTRSREAANAALPPLVTYFRLLASATPGGFDVEEAARLELDWWQARREAVGPGQYGVTLVRVAAITYGKPADDPSLLISGVGRAEAMAYCDARGQAMTDPTGQRSSAGHGARTGR
jgi:hypothetical protein